MEITEHVPTTPVGVGVPPLRRFLEAVDERLGLGAVSYPIPAHANGILYTLGGITLVGLVFQLITGILLAQYYDPTPAGAYDSVRYIMTQAPLGDFLRGLHYWMANAVMLGIILHVVRVFVSGAYKPPREATWLVGVAALALTAGAVFTGTVLRWDQEAFEAFEHVKEIGELLGPLGAVVSTSFTPTIHLLTRYYGAHIVILPLLLVVTLMAHFFLIKRHGLAPLPSKDAMAMNNPKGYGERMTSYSSHLRVMLGWGLVLTAVIAMLSVFFQTPLGPAPMPGKEMTKPMWMFNWIYPLEDWIGLRGLTYGPIALFALLLLVPFIDRTPLRAVEHRKAILVAAALVVAVVVALGVYAGASPTANHLMGG